MDIEKIVRERSTACEFCGSTKNLSVFEVAPPQNLGADGYALTCSTCLEQIEDPEKTDANHWRCLNDSMWSSVPAVQVQSWRMLNRLRSEGWPGELLDMLYLDEETAKWAKALQHEQNVVHKDSNGAVLEAGDTVVLIKDLKVKGANFIAKRGTAVRRISLDPDNATYIEGKVDGQHIVILTDYVKKSKP